MTHPLEERAREFLSPYFDMLDDLGPIKMNRDAHAAKLAASYAQVQAEAWLEEAKWWDDFLHGLYDTNTRLAPEAGERLAKLAKAAAPATKEE